MAMVKLGKEMELGIKTYLQHSSEICLPKSTAPEERDPSLSRSGKRGGEEKTKRKRWVEEKGRDASAEVDRKALAA